LGIPFEGESLAKKSDSKQESKKKDHEKSRTSKMPRKYSDNKYDKPEYEAKIEQQTLRAIEAMTREPVQKKEEIKKQQKNVFGLNF